MRFLAQKPSHSAESLIWWEYRLAWSAKKLIGNLCLPIYYTYDSFLLLLFGYLSVCIFDYLHQASKADFCCKIYSSRKQIVINFWATQIPLVMISKEYLIICRGIQVSMFKIRFLFKYSSDSTQLISIKTVLSVMCMTFFKSKKMSIHVNLNSKRVGGFV